MCCQLKLFRRFIVIGFISLIVSCSKHIPHQATGIKIGEVTDTSAIIWARLMLNPERVGSDAPMPDISYVHAETGEDIKEAKRLPYAIPTVHFPDGFDATNIIIIRIIERAAVSFGAPNASQCVDNDKSCIRMSVKPSVQFF